MPINIPNVSQWEDDVPAIQLGDLLLGDDAAAADATGPLNLGRKALANRTLYLKGVVDGLTAQIGGAMTEAQANLLYHRKGQTLDLPVSVSTHKMRLGYGTPITSGGPYVTAYDDTTLLGYLQWTPGYTRLSHQLLGGDLRIKGVGVAEINGQLLMTRPASDARYMRPEYSTTMTGLLSLGYPSGTQLRVGYGTGQQRQPLVGWYDGETTRRGYIQSTDIKFMIARDGGAHLDLREAGTVLLNGLRIATENHANNADNLSSGTVPYQRLPLSTEANALAGTNGSTVMTPYRVHQAIDARIAAIQPGDLHSYVWATYVGPGFDAGDSIAGADLRPAGIAGSSTSVADDSQLASQATVLTTGSPAYSGTWRAMTSNNVCYPATVRARYGLFRRIL